MTDESFQPNNYARDTGEIYRPERLRLYIHGQWATGQKVDHDKLAEGYQLLQLVNRANEFIANRQASLQRAKLQEWEEDSWGNVHPSESTAPPSLALTDVPTVGRVERPSLQQYPPLPGVIGRY